MTHTTTPTGDTTAAGPQRRRRIVWIVLAAAVAAAVIAAVVVLATGAGASSDSAAVFVTQPGFAPGATPPCLEHQTAEPNSAYQGGDTSQPAPQLTFLAYYTAAGKLPFCDGQPATDTDKTWAQLYVQLTTNADNVSTILG